MAIKFANVGQTDRLLRALAGIVLVVLPFVGVIDKSSVYGIVAMGVGAVLLVTAVIKFCPAYTLLGLRTNSKS